MICILHRAQNGSRWFWLMFWYSSTSPFYKEEMSKTCQIQTFYIGMERTRMSNHMYAVLPSLLTFLYGRDWRKSLRLNRASECKTWWNATINGAADWGWIASLIRAHLRLGDWHTGHLYDEGRSSNVWRPSYIHLQNVQQPITNCHSVALHTFSVWFNCEAGDGARSYCRVSTVSIVKWHHSIDADRLWRLISLWIQSTTQLTLLQCRPTFWTWKGKCRV